MGGERTRPVVVPHYGVMFRNTGLRFDELVRLAAERGFLTQADLDSDFDNGGKDKLSDMIRRMLAGENIRPVSGMEADNEAEWRRQAEARWEAMDEAGRDLVESATDDEINALIQEVSDEDQTATDAELNAIASAEAGSRA